MHGGQLRRGSTAVRIGGHVAAILGKHPQARSARTGHARQHDGVPRSRDELDIRVGRRNPSFPNTYQQSFAEG